MLSIHRFSGACFALVHLIPFVLGDCQSFGIDFQNGGTYFQNSLSSDPFTALQQFEGCQNDTAHNVFVDPQGDQSECSLTPLLPDDTPQQIVCSQWPKSSLYTGAWSLLILSNNGNGTPIAFQRDFSLTVAPQQTTTLPATTVTGGSAGTVTVTQQASTVTVTRGTLEVTQTTSTTATAGTVVTVSAACPTTATSASQDPTATVAPTINSLTSLVSGLFGIGGLKARNPDPTPLPAYAHFRDAIIQGRSPSDEIKAAFVAERKRQLNKRRVDKRAPDEPTVTAAASTVNVASTVTTTAAARTSTVSVGFLVRTVTSTRTITTTSTVTSSAATLSCA